MEEKKLIQMALKARKRSYSPYSKHAVGAALRTSDGNYYQGCNIENSSYGGTVCAERTAIWKAISEGHSLIDEIAVVTDSPIPWPPCGLCLQIMAEFASPDLKMHMANLKGKVETYPFRELFPKAFYSRFLKKPSKN